MAKIEALNPQIHRQTKINTQFSDKLGYHQGAVMVMPNELRDVQREYAILFRKHADTGRLFPNALLGFSEQENLYINSDNEWQADYVPMAFKKGPFLIGFKQSESGRAPIISIDIDDPRVFDDSKAENLNGEAIFDADSQPTEYLLQINDILMQMHENSALMTKMVDVFNQLGLIEPLTLDIQLHNGEEINFGGAYTISEEKLMALKGQDLENLNSTGFLSAAYYIAGSLGNIQKLIKFKKQQNI
jgi:hypothetical protein